MKFTPLYEFTVLEKTEKEVPKTEVIEGVEKKVLVRETVEKPVKILFKKPGRRDEEEGDLFYSKKMHEFMKAGILTRAMMANKYKDTGGFVSEATAKEYGETVLHYLDLEKEIALLKANKKLTAKQKEKVETLEKDYAATQKKIIDLQAYQDSLMSQSADDKAQNELLRWYALNFFYIQKDEEDEPELYFKGQTHEDKLDSYYELEDEMSDLHKQIAPKIGTAAAVYYYRRVKNPEEFQKIIDEAEKATKDWTLRI